MMTEGTERVLKNYEYRVKATPEYCCDINEQWELVDVFLKRLENGYRNYVLVFRKEIKEQQQ